MFAKLSVCGMFVMACCATASATELLGTALFQHHASDTMGADPPPLDPRAVFKVRTPAPDAYALTSELLLNGQLATQDFDATSPSFAGLAGELTDSVDGPLHFQIAYTYFNLGTFQAIVTSQGSESEWFGGSTLAGMEVTNIRMEVEELSFWRNDAANLMGVDARVRWEFHGNLPEPGALVSLLAGALCLRRRV